MIILQIKESMRRKKFDEALELIEQIPENFRTSEIFLLKGICIQLSENLKFNLNEAEYSFKKAIELDSNNIEAKIELGWFYFNVLDQSKEADKEFVDALEIIKSKLSELVEGFMKINLESSTYFDANQFITDYTSLILKEEKLKALIAENESLR